MPKELIIVAERKAVLADYELPPLQPYEVRVKTELTALKHGTEMAFYRGTAPRLKKNWDPQLRLYRPASEEEKKRRKEKFYKHPMGNMSVGTVIETGSEVKRFKVGDKVFGYMPIREIQQVQEDALILLNDLDPESAVCFDPAHVAFVAVRDGNIRIGDCVAIFGLGAIGLMAVQIAKASGAYKVFGIDPINIRRKYAEQHGADKTFDPQKCDVGLEIKLTTQKRGADVAIETSGDSSALHQAIRCVVQCGTIVHLAFNQTTAGKLHLGEEWHLNRPTLIGSQAVHDNPDRGYPAWNEVRCRETVLELLRAQKITGKGMITPTVPLEKALHAIQMIDEEPEKTIKVGITYK